MLQIIINSKPEALQDMNMSWREAKRVVNDHQRWRNLVDQCSNENWRN